MASRNYWTISNGKIAKGIIEFKWEAGMSTSQKRKSCFNMHSKLLFDYGLVALDISTASTTRLGAGLSAFNLMWDGKTVECWYQGSKVYKNHGTVHELYNKSSLEAKMFVKSLSEDKVVGFELVKDNQIIKYPINPKTVFYDWIYLQGMLQTYGKDIDLNAFTGFTDIQAVLNVDACQARTVCEYKLIQNNNEWSVMESFDLFYEWHQTHVEYEHTPKLVRAGNVQLDEEHNALYYRKREMIWPKVIRLLTRVPEHVCPGYYNAQMDKSSIDDSYCVIYTDALLDDLCAIEFLSTRYANAVVHITNWHDIPTSDYAPDNYSVYNFFDDVTSWFSNVIFATTPLCETKLQFIDVVDCFVLCNASAIIKDGISNYKNIIVMGGYDKTHTRDEEEWNASQDIESFVKLYNSTGIDLYTKVECEELDRINTFAKLNLEYYNMYKYKMTELNDSTCCYDLQAVVHGCNSLLTR